MPVYDRVKQGNRDAESLIGYIMHPMNGLIQGTEQLLAAGLQTASLRAYVVAK